MRVNRILIGLLEQAVRVSDAQIIALENSGKVTFLASYHYGIDFVRDFTAKPEFYDEIRALG